MPPVNTIEEIAKKVESVGNEVFKSPNLSNPDIKYM